MLASISSTTLQRGGMSIVRKFPPSLDTAKQLVQNGRTLYIF